MWLGLKKMQKVADWLEKLIADWMMGMVFADW